MESEHEHVLEVLMRYASGPTARGMLRRALADAGDKSGEPASAEDTGFIEALEQGIRLFIDESNQAALLHELRSLGTQHNQTIVRLATEHDARRARTIVRDMLTPVGASRRKVLLVCSAVAELTGNMVTHAGGGELELRLSSDPTPKVTVIARDRGPGITDLDAVLGAVDEGKGTRRGTLGSIRELADHFEVETGPSGTTVTFEAVLS